MMLYIKSSDLTVIDNKRVDKRKFTFVGQFNFSEKKLSEENVLRHSAAGKLVLLQPSDVKRLNLLNDMY
ncbi:MAG: hypothetical protein LBH80_02150 [Prevotellaceae bacterium]|nr:hypothetical protein [Prevotellaceae bacterium]